VDVVLYLERFGNSNGTNYNFSFTILVITKHTRIQTLKTNYKLHHTTYSNVFRFHFCALQYMTNAAVNWYTFCVCAVCIIIIIVIVVFGKTALFLRRFCEVASSFHFFGFCNNNFFYRARSPALHPTPNLEDSVSVFMSSSDRVAQLYT
jgi:hypothetical protein